MVRITDCERVATVTPTQLGQFHCPKCVGVCNERSPEKRPDKWRMWDCSRCGRGWSQVPMAVTTVEQAMAFFESDNETPKAAE